MLSIDKNSIEAAVNYSSGPALKIDPIKVCIYETNSDASRCGLIAEPTRTILNHEFKVNSGNQNFVLPVIDHLPGYEISQKFFRGNMTLSDG